MSKNQNEVLTVERIENSVCLLVREDGTHFSLELCADGLHEGAKIRITDGKAELLPEREASERARIKSRMSSIFKKR